MYGVRRPAMDMVPVTHEILAWRGWNLTTDDGTHLDFVTGKPGAKTKLTSINQGTVWEGPTLIADIPPTEHGATGIYAVTKDGIGNALSYSPLVLGEVALSGIVVE